jgi:signal transduction histidine kinase
VFDASGAPPAPAASPFVNRRSPEGDWLADQRVEWCAEGITPQLANPALQAWSYRGTGNGWMFERLAEGGSVGGPLEDLPFNFRRILEAQQIRSILLVPVMAHGAFWGFLGFDDCWAPHRWAELEAGALRLAASILAAAVERQDAEASLRESEEKLRRTLRIEASVRLAAGLSRDFEGLLATLRESGERLLAGLGTGDALRGEVSEMLLAAERAADLTRELVVFCSQQPSRPVRLDLGAWLGSSTLCCGIAGDGVGSSYALCRSWAGRNRSRSGEQALVALVRAFDRMVAGGGSGHAAEVPGSEVSARGAPEVTASIYQRITLRDDAPRLESAAAERLFEPFSDGTGDVRGPRLGLSIVYGIVRQCGGFAAAESRAGEGNVFDLYLPVAPPEIADGERGERPARVLLVETRT